MYMQKRLLFVASLLLAICNTMLAAAQLTIGDVSMYPGVEKTVSVELTNDTAYVGFQFDLYLPDGITVEDFAGSDRLPSGTTPQMAAQPDGSYRFIAAALSGNAIPSNSGAVMTITLTASQTTAAGGYVGYMRNVKVSKADGSGVVVAEQPFAITVKDAEAYAVLNGTTLTFYYDKQVEERGGMILQTFTSDAQRPWHSAAASIQTVTFDTSFAAYLPTATARWFSGCTALTTLNGLDNLNTSEVTYMDGMFTNCSSLKTLYISNNWDLSKVTSSISMFNNCTSLVGGQWTAYASSMTTATYARIDGGSAAPGYFTSLADNAEVAPVTYSRSGHTVTLSSATANTHIMYKLSSDTEPQWKQYTEPLTLTGDCVITAYAERPSGLRSAETEYNFVLNANFVEAPTIARVPNQNAVVITNGSGTGTVYYNFDENGMLTTANAQAYTAPIAVTQNVRVNAAVVIDGVVSSDITSFQVDWFKAEKPTIAWSGDEMSLATTTDDGVIYYKLDAGSSATQYTGAVTVQWDATIYAWTEKEGYNNSDTLVVDYPYSAWEALKQAWTDGEAAITAAAGNDNVPETLITQLNVLITNAKYAYNERTMQKESINNVTDEIQQLTTQINQLANAENEPYAVLADNTLTFYYDKKKEERNGMDVQGFGDPGSRPWNSAAGSITTVVFDDSFASCTSLTSMYCWFYNFSELTTIEGIGNLHTDYVTDMSALFSGCSKLTTLDLTGFNTANVTNMFSMFDHCSGLTSLDLSSFNTAKVEDMRYMFQQCTGLTTLDLSTFNTASVTYMDEMFAYCSNLTTIYVDSEWVIGESMSGSHMFRGCEKLVGGMGTTYDTNYLHADYAHVDGGTANPGYFTPKSGYVAAPTFSREGNKVFIACATEGAVIRYTIDGEAPTATTGTVYADSIVVASNCTIRAIALHDGFYPSQVVDYTVDWFKAATPTYSWAGDVLTATTTTTYAFVEMKQTLLNDPTISEANGDVQTVSVTIQQDVHIDIYATKSGWANSDTVSIDYYYTKWKALTDAITVAQSVITTATGNDNVPQTMLDELAGLIQTANQMYDERSATVTVVEQQTADLQVLADNIMQLVNAESEPYAVLSDGNTVLTFYYDKKKDERGGMSVGPFDIPDDRGWATQSADITTVVFDDSFADCTTLTSTAMWLYGFQKLTTITGINNLKTGNVTDMQYMFHDCNLLTSIDLSGFNTANVTNTSGMFYKCHKLGQLDLSGFNTAKVQNTSWMFYGCYDLATIYVGSAWSTASVGESEEMFVNCSKLVGGAWTAYDNSYVEADYAHIDGGTANPGYLTSIADTAAVAVVTYSHVGHTVTLHNTTANTHIIYNLSTWPFADDKPQWRQYTEPVTLTADCVITAYAIRPSGLRSADTEYNFVLGFVEAPTIARDGDEDRVVITNNSTTGTVYYNFADNGLLTADTAEPYTDPIAVTQNVRINAAVIIDGVVSSDITSFQVDWFKVATPTFTWDADKLTATTTTAGAFIEVQLTLLGDSTVSMSIGDVQTVSDTIQADVHIDIYAVKDGWTDADVVSFDYPYTAWKQLLDDVVRGQEILHEADLSDKVDKTTPGAPYTTLTDLLNDANNLYTERTADRSVIENLTDQISETITLLQNEMNAEDEFSFDANGVLHVFGNGLLEDALAAAGGREEVAKTLTAILWDKQQTLTDDMLQGLTGNPNLLIYVPGIEQAPVTVHNVVVGEQAQDILLVDSETGNTDFYCPRTFTADKISYTRNFTQKTQVGVTRGWESIVLPFTVQTITHESHGLLAPFGNDASTQHFWLRQLSPDGLERATEIVAYRPYLISMPNDSANYSAASCHAGRVTFTATDADVMAATPQPAVLADETRRLIGTTRRVAAADDIYVLNVGQPDSTYLEGSVFVRNLRGVRPFECFTLHVGDGSRYISFDELSDKSTLGIAGTMYDGMKQEQWFTIDGRKLQRRPATKGVYILNGRKVVVK